MRENIKSLKSIGFTIICGFKSKGICSFGKTIEISCVKEKTQTVAFSKIPRFHTSTLRRTKLRFVLIIREIVIYLHPWNLLENISNTVVIVLLIIIAFMKKL